MKKYNYVFLKIENGTIINYYSQSRLYREALVFNYAIYIYRNSKTKQLYIGQTIHFMKRNDEHFDGSESKFNSAKFDEVIVLFSRYFDRSALEDVEKQLITYFTADRSRKRRNCIYFDDKVLNIKNGNETSEYFEKDKVLTEVMIPFWKDILYPNKWVESQTIDSLQSSVLVKYSPIKTLTNQQEDLINQIIYNHDKSFVINGDAGTGKTVLLTHLVAHILNNSNYKIAVVVQPNWKKTAEKIFSVYSYNSVNLTISTSTSLINNDKYYDIIIVDESHKLSRRFGKQNPSFNSVYKDKYKDFNSHLEIINTMGDQIILMYDILQSIRPANITRNNYLSLTSDFEQKYLTTQFRINSPLNKNYSSDDYINGIKWLLYKDTGLLEYTSFNPNFNRDVFKDNLLDSYFGYFETKPLHNLFNWLDVDTNFHPNHINRVLAGLVEEWHQKDGKNPKITHWHEGDLDLRWNSTQEDWINSSDKDSEQQIGSVFAVQGIDLNKVGVLIGNDLQVDNNGKLYAEPNNFYNINGKFDKNTIDLPKNRYEFTIFVLNIYYVLMTRGIDGIRLGFWHNPDFLKYMKKTLDC